MVFRGIPRRWDLFDADLDFPVGSEQGGKSRPVLIISNDGFNAAFALVTVVPLTKQSGKQRKIYSFEVLLSAGMAGNPLDSIVMPQQVRTIARQRLLGPPFGALRDDDLRREIEDKLLQQLGIGFDDSSEIDTE